MSNRILNGDFSSDFNHWDNGVGGGRAFFYIFEKALASSDPSSDTTWGYKMLQEFSSNDEIVTATITAWAGWSARESDTDGEVELVVNLERPDSTIVNLYDATKTGETDDGLILDGADIKRHFNQYGNYKLWLIAYVTSAVEDLGGPPGPEYRYLLSRARYDNISIDITVKKYKTVHEILGSTGVLGGKASVSRSEAVGLVEAYSTETFSPEFNYETASESVGLSESYSRLIKRIRGAVEVVGLSEAIQAKRTQGNMETTYVLEDLTQWTEISQVETPWIKTKIEIS